MKKKAIELTVKTAITIKEGENVVRKERKMAGKNEAALFASWYLAIVKKNIVCEEE